MCFPNLPDANYAVWSRGYGLIDSAKVTEPPREASFPLTAVTGTNAARGCVVIPGEITGFRSSRCQPRSQFPVGMIRHQAQWISQTKSSRFQMGSPATRELHPKLQGHSAFTNTIDALRYATERGADAGDPDLPAGLSPCSASGSISCRRGPFRHRGRRALRRNRTQPGRDDVGCVEPDSLHARRRQRRQAKSADECVWTRSTAWNFTTTVSSSSIRENHTERTITIPAQVDKSLMRAVHATDDGSSSR